MTADMFDGHPHFTTLLARAADLPALPVAVVAPDERDALLGPVLAGRLGVIAPILIGDADRIAALARDLDLDLAGCEIVSEPDAADAAAQAVQLVHSGAAGAVMKGHLHTDTFMRAVIRTEGGLRIGRRLTHCFAMDVPRRDKLLFITDAAVNVAPDLATKAEIAQNAIDLARALGLDTPRLAVLSAMEKVNPAIASSLDAALLAKMADRGQITGGLVDGPLAMDNAVDAKAAAVKGIASPVAGQADILLAPTMEAGNMIYKALMFLAGAVPAGLVLGAKCPVILTSRAGGVRARVASSTVAAIAAAHGAV
jgi:phosphate butyryltransferase